MVGAQGQVKVAKKSSTYDVTNKKPAPLKQEIFFQVQTTRLAASFWHLDQVRNPYRSGDIAV